jgi:hypothetical protein
LNEATGVERVFGMRPEADQRSGTVVAVCRSATHTMFKPSIDLEAGLGVNNSVHVNWMKHGRLCYLRERGMT